MEFRERLQVALGSAYTLERELGGGGMSRVFVAEETSLGRKVVVKVLPPELAAALSAERFEREVRLAAQLQHPQIVPVLTAGDADGVPYYTMPLVEGESLRAQLARDGALPVARAVSVLRDVAKALEFAHARGVVHRDIKPDNVLLAGSSAAVTDFGIAKALSASKAAAAPGGTLTQLGTSIGTPAYMAPEQAAGDPDTDHRADIYAFGCMAYELLTGTTPFGDKPPHQLIAAHFAERPVPVEQRRGDVPRALANLVMRCLEKNPKDRPQSATELLAELETATARGAAAGVSPGRSAGGKRWVIGAGVAVAAVVIAALVWGRRSAPPVNEQIIAVLPFRVAGADPSLAYLREGMLDLLSAKLTAGGGVRPVDTRTVLAAWRKAGGDERTDVPEDAWRRIATMVGAGELLVGDIVGGGKQVTIHASLIGAASGKRADASVSGAVDSVQAMVDRLTAALLTLRAGETEQRLAALTSTSLPALHAYLDGQADYRRGRWASASAAFNAALDADTTFGLAALGVLQANGWFHETRDLPRAYRVAWRSRDRFSPRDRALVTVLLGANYPKPQTLGERGAAADRYTTVAPDSPDAWYQVGDWNFHYGRGAGIEDAFQRSLNAFSRALQLDSTYTPAWEHLPMLFAAVGDSANLRRAIGMLAATDSGNTLAGDRMVAAAELGDSDEVRALRAQIPRMPFTTLFEIVDGGVAGHLGLDDARRAMSAIAASAVTPYDRYQANLTEMIFESDLGHPTKAVEALRKLKGALVPQQMLFGAVLWDWDSTGTGTVARQIDEEARKQADGTPTDRLNAEFSFAAIAQYQAWQGDTAGLARTADALRRLTFPNDTSGHAAVHDRFQAALDAQLATMTHRPDARSLLVRLDSIVESDPEGQLLILGNVIAARGWESVGDASRALAALHRLDGDGTPGLYYTTLLREQGRVAALAGDRVAAIRSYRQYLALRADPDPALRAQTDRVRAELQRLEAQQAK